MSLSLLTDAADPNDRRSLEVLLLLDTSPRPFTCDPFVPNASDDEAAPHVPGTYLCETVLDGTEGDGLQFIQILAGQGGKPGCSRCHILFDFQPPELSQVAFTPPEVRLNMSATLLVAANEPLKGATFDVSDAPLLSWADLELLGLIPTNRLELTWEFQSNIGSSTTDGVYSVSTVTVEDRVGNSSEIDVSEIRQCTSNKNPRLDR